MSWRIVAHQAVQINSFEAAPERKEKRRANAHYYFDHLKGVRLPYIDPKHQSIFNQFTILSSQRDQIQAHLQDKQIGNMVYYPIPLHLQGCFKALGYK